MKTCHFRKKYQVSHLLAVGQQVSKFSQVLAIAESAKVFDILTNLDLTARYFLFNVSKQDEVLYVNIDKNFFVSFPLAFHPKTKLGSRKLFWKAL